MMHLNSLWIGKELGYLERLCVVSAMAAGHTFTIYSYTPDDLKNVPEGAVVRDAHEVMTGEKFLRYFKIGRDALGSNFFRYHLLAKGLGCWVDMDMYFIKPVDPAPYIFGWEHERSINNAILYADRNSELLNYLLELPKENWLPPFFGPKRRAIFHWNKLTKGPIWPEHLDWGSFGPSLITYLAKKYRVADQAKSRKVFYPVPYEAAKALFESDRSTIEEMITHETQTVHFWNSKLFDFVKKPPPRGSYIDKACRLHGV